MKNQCLYNKAVSHWWAKKLSLTRQLKGLQECQMAVSIIPAGRKIAVLLGAWRSNCTEKEYKNDSSGLSKMCFAQSCASVAAYRKQIRRSVSFPELYPPSSTHLLVGELLSQRLYTFLCIWWTCSGFVVVVFPIYVFYIQKILQQSVPQCKNLLSVIFVLNPLNTYCCMSINSCFTNKDE